MLYYKTPYTHQLKGVTKIIFTVIKEGSLANLLNANFNDTAQKKNEQRQFIRVRAYKIVWQLQEVRRAYLKYSMERNRRLLVRSHNLDVLHASLKR